MPRFHFDVHDGAGGPDAEGIGPTDRRARLEAVRPAGGIPRGGADRIAPGEDGRIPSRTTVPDVGAPTPRAAGIAGR